MTSPQPQRGRSNSPSARPFWTLQNIVNAACGTDSKWFKTQAQLFEYIERENRQRMRQAQHQNQNQSQSSRPVSQQPRGGGGGYSQQHPSSSSSRGSSLFGGAGAGGGGGGSRILGFTDSGDLELSQFNNNIGGGSGSTRLGSQFFSMPRGGGGAAGVGAAAPQQQSKNTSGDLLQQTQFAPATFTQFNNAVGSDTELLRPFCVQIDPAGAPLPTTLTASSANNFNSSSSSASLSTASAMTPSVARINQPNFSSASAAGASSYCHATTQKKMEASVFSKFNQAGNTQRERLPQRRAERTADSRPSTPAAAATRNSTVSATSTQLTTTSQATPLSIAPRAVSPQRAPTVSTTHQQQSRFFVAMTMSDFAERVAPGSTIPHSQQHFFEIIQDGAPCVLYFDVEMEPPHALTKEEHSKLKKDFDAATHRNIVTPAKQQQKSTNNSSSSLFLNDNQDDGNNSSMEQQQKQQQPWWHLSKEKRVKHRCCPVDCEVTEFDPSLARDVLIEELKRFTNDVLRLPIDPETINESNRNNSDPFGNIPFSPLGEGSSSSGGGFVQHQQPHTSREELLLSAASTPPSSQGATSDIFNVELVSTQEHRKSASNGNAAAGGSFGSLNDGSCNSLPGASASAAAAASAPVPQREFAKIDDSCFFVLVSESPAKFSQHYIVRFTDEGIRFANNLDVKVFVTSFVHYLYERAVSDNRVHRALFFHESTSRKYCSYPATQTSNTIISNNNNSNDDLSRQPSSSLEGTSQQLLFLSGASDSTLTMRNSGFNFETQNSFDSQQQLQPQPQPQPQQEQKMQFPRTSSGSAVAAAPPPPPPPPPTPALPASAVPAVEGGGGGGGGFIQSNYSLPAIGLRCIIDEAVYSRNRMMRCLGSCKLGKSAVLQFDPTWHEAGCRGGAVQMRYEHGHPGGMHGATLISEPFCCGPSRGKEGGRTSSGSGSIGSSSSNSLQTQSTQQQQQQQQQPPSAAGTQAGAASAATTTTTKSTFKLIDSEFLTQHAISTGNHTLAARAPAHGPAAGAGGGGGGGASSVVPQTRSIVVGAGGGACGASHHGSRNPFAGGMAGCTNSSSNTANFGQAHDSTEMNAAAALHKLPLLCGHIVQSQRKLEKSNMQQGTGGVGVESAQVHVPKGLNEMLNSNDGAVLSGKSPGRGDGVTLHTITMNFKIRGSRYCYCVSRPHRSNGVFWIVKFFPFSNSGTAEQRCFDEDCKRSARYSESLPAAVVDELATYFSTKGKVAGWSATGDGSNPDAVATMTSEEINARNAQAISNCPFSDPRLQFMMEQKQQQQQPNTGAAAGSLSPGVSSGSSSTTTAGGKNNRHAGPKRTLFKDIVNKQQQQNNTIVASPSAASTGNNQDAAAAPPK